MKLVLYLVGLVVLSVVAWKVIVGANAKGDQIPDAPKATLDRVRDRTQHAMDQEQQRFDDAMKRTSQAASE